MHLPHGAKRQTPRRIIVHAMGEMIQSGDGAERRIYPAAEWLDHLGLSAHALVSPTGEVVRCRVDEEGAWHAKGHNEDSLGVEVLVPGVHTYATLLRAIRTEYVTPAAWTATLRLVRDWMRLWSIPVDRVQRHSDVDPGRKYDPGSGFAWAPFLDLLEAA